MNFKITIIFDLNCVKKANKQISQNISNCSFNYLTCHSLFVMNLKHTVFAIRRYCRMWEDNLKTLFLDVICQNFEYLCCCWQQPESPPAPLHTSCREVVDYLTNRLKNVKYIACGVDVCHTVCGVDQITCCSCSDSSLCGYFLACLHCKTACSSNKNPV